MRALRWWFLGALAAQGCKDAAPAPQDAAADVAAADLGADTAMDASTLPPWPRTLPVSSALGAPPGYRVARSIVHAHSVHSHDACDNTPYVDGGPNEPCLRHFREAACATHLDVIFLTEHAGHMAEGPFARVLQPREDDELVPGAAGPIGVRIHCRDGHRVLVLPGAENELMPIGLTRHPDPVDGGLNRAYHAEDPAGVRRFREAGALVAIPHTEQRSVALLRELSPDLIEIYNVHANADPRLAMQWLGLDVGPSLVDLLRFAREGSELEPDLAFITFFRESPTDLRTWATLLSEGRRIPGVGGTDVHENTFTGLLRDGERGDSYRRLFRFFANMVLVSGEVNRETVLDALRAGRSYTAFEAWGTPVGFAFTAEAAGRSALMGAEVALSSRPTLTARRPSVYELPATLPPPRITMRLLRAETDGRWTVVAEGAGETLEHRPEAPGVYRAEVRIVPEHARPYLPGMERLVRELPWVYANPIYVTP
ncbi:MAG: hypothetical protein HY909_03005 [Deltaproteobacteria bacterium]|nr:hypothetical protein [Deltaproteobacteria bacterium]